MPRVTPDYVPAYRLHKASGQAIVTLSGKDHLLGAFGTPPSRVKYHQLVADWIAGERKPLVATRIIASPVEALGSMSVASLVDAFKRHVNATYIDTDGNPQKSATAYIERCTGFASDLFGSTPAAEFSPSMAKECRARMVKAGWTRKGCNRGLRMIRMMFKWAVESELVPASTLDALKAIAPLKAGRTTAPESDPVKPVADAWVNAVKPHVSAPVWALILLQRLTGARAGELVTLRPTDINTSGNVWTYRPIRHKTKHHGHDRIIYFGPKAQDVLQPLLQSRTKIDAYLFDPREGYAQRKAAHATKGKPRRANQKRNAKSSEREIGEHYTTASYRRAIAYGCKRAGIDTWNPHQLRHAAATSWRAAYGPDAALTLLGDKSSNMVEVYAARDHQTAIRIASEVG